MGISAIGSQLVSSLNQILHARLSSSITARSETSGGSETDSVEGVSKRVSKPAQLLSKLQQLQEQDPEKLKEVLAQIADALRSAAAADDSEESQFLTMLADKFDEAAKTGDLSVLQPPAPPNGPPPESDSSDQANSSASSSNAIAKYGQMSGERPKPSAEMEQLMSTILDIVNQALSA